MAFLLIISSLNGQAIAQGLVNGSDEEWSFSAFGGNTSAERNPEPEAVDNGITLTATGGKISSSDEGMSFYFKEVPADTNFELRAKAKVISFNSNGSISTPNQKSFGLMLKDEIGSHRDSSTHTSSYMAIGALDTVMKGFNKKGTQTKLETFSENAVPLSGEVYDLSIKKSGETYVLTSNGESEIVTIEELFSDQLFAGIYVARDAEVVFQDLEIVIDDRQVNELFINDSEMKKEYLIGESLNLQGLAVTVVFEGGEERLLTEDEYIVSGFDSITPGPNTVTIHFLGASSTLDITILSLNITAVDIIYFQLKQFIMWEILLMQKE